MEQFFRGDPFMQQRMQSAQKNTTPQLEHNYLVLEITNNWEAVLELYEKIEKGDVDLLSQMEGTWVQFLSRTDIKQFESSEDFERKMLKPLVKK